MNRTLRISAAIAVTMLVLGCKETTSSEFIRTGGIAAVMNVTAESADTSRVHVELRVGGPTSNTYVILDNGDQLHAESGSEMVDLNSVDEGVYEGTFKIGGPAEFTVGLERNDDEDAPNSRAMLPEPFSLSAPAMDSIYSRANDAITIQWDPAISMSDGGSIEVRGSCIFSESITVSGVGGTSVIEKGTLRSVDEKKPESCKVDVTMTVKRQGTPDVAFDADSQFWAFQRRTVSFTSNP